MNLDDLYEKSAAFHAHSCPGLALGFRMVIEAMQFLGADRSSDEELAAIAECDFCGVDALQVVSGFDKAVIETMAKCQCCHEQVTMSRVAKNEGDLCCIPCSIQAGNVT
ncbi:MAG: FmdE family protein [Chitinispirillaceae bacterium]